MSWIYWPINPIIEFPISSNFLNSIVFIKLTTADPLNFPNLTCLGWTAAVGLGPGALQRAERCWSVGPEMGIHRVLEKSWEKPWKTHGTSSDFQGQLGRKEVKKPIIWRYLKDPIGRSSSCDMLWLQKTAEVTPCHTNLAKRMLSRTELRAPTYRKSHTNNLPQRNSDDLLINDWSSIFSKAGNHHANASYTIEKQVGCWIVCVYAVKMMMNFRIATAMTMIMIILQITFYSTLMAM